MNFISSKKFATGFLAAIAAVAMLTAAPTEASELIFDQINNDGTLSFNGAGGPLVGTDIVFESITGVDTDNDVTIDCDGCLLNFTTGALISEVGGEYAFAGGGTFEIVGGSILGGIPAGTVLVSGTFIGPVELEIDGAGGLTILFLTAAGSDTKDDLLVDFFFDPPFPEDFTSAQTTVQVTVNGINTGLGPNGNGFTADLEDGGNADFVNAVTVPEPGTTMLFLLGLAGLAARRRRQS